VSTGVPNGHETDESVRAFTILGEWVIKPWMWLGQLFAVRYLGWARRHRPWSLVTLLLIVVTCTACVAGIGWVIGGETGALGLGGALWLFVLAMTTFDVMKVHRRPAAGRTERDRPQT
jgi:hypothetical protein